MVPSGQPAQVHNATGGDDARDIVFHAAGNVLEDLVQMAVAQAPELHAPPPPATAGAKKGSPSTPLRLTSE
eukprot:7688267-Lingulodinium_polyedra.AAC.1